MVVMASLLVRKIELQREYSQRDFKIRSNHGKEIIRVETFESRKGNYKSFLRKFHCDLNL